jgi:hypothetical protein
MKHLSGMKRKFHVPFLEEGERETALSYSTKPDPILIQQIFEQITKIGSVNAS